MIEVLLIMTPLLMCVYLLWTLARVEKWSVKKQQEDEPEVKIDYNDPETQRRMTQEISDLLAHWESSKNCKHKDKK